MELKDKREKFIEATNFKFQDKDIEAKNGFSYISWAKAWREFKKIFPDATYEIWRNEQGINLFGNKETGYMCYTDVTANGETHTMWLPIMDFKNKSKLNPDSMDINKTTMRCLVKNLGMFGVGLYVYEGEDLPFDYNDLKDWSDEMLDGEIVGDQNIINYLKKQGEALESLTKERKVELVAIKYRLKK